jgi:hypothetical protein
MPHATPLSAQAPLWYCTQDTHRAEEVSGGIAEPQQSKIGPGSQGAGAAKIRKGATISTMAVGMIVDRKPCEQGRRT